MDKKDTQLERKDTSDAKAWERSAQLAFEAIEKSGLWPHGASAPSLIIVKPPKTATEKMLSLPFARAFVQTGAWAARRAFPSVRANATLLAAEHGQAGSALAICDPKSLAIVIPQSWTIGHRAIEMSDAMNVSEEQFRFFICAHELGHLALAARKDPNQGMAEAVVAAASLPEEDRTAILRAIGPRNADDGWAMVQAQWRSMLFEGMADSCATVAASRAGFDAEALASAIARARETEMESSNENMAAFHEEGGRDHDTRSAMFDLANKARTGKLGMAEDLFMECARSACAGLLSELRLCIGNDPLGLGALILSRQGSIIDQRMPAVPRIDFSKLNRPELSSAASISHQP